MDETLPSIAGWHRCAHTSLTEEKKATRKGGNDSWKLEGRNLELGLMRNFQPNTTDESSNPKSPRRPLLVHRRNDPKYSSFEQRRPLWVASVICDIHPFVEEDSLFALFETSSTHQLTPFVWPFDCAATWGPTWRLGRESGFPGTSATCPR